MPTPPRCSRCNAPATHTARRHATTLGMCLAHHAHVWQGLVADGWIVSAVAVKAKVPA